MKPICIIPVRSGSKGLKDKNMLYVDHKPLVFHTIEAAIHSGLFELDRIFVSTDSLEYARVCQEKGVQVLIRSSELASDTATTYDVLEDFLHAFPDNQPFILLQATSPLRTGETIREAYQLFEKQRPDSVVSIAKVEKHPRLFTTLGSNGQLQDIVGVDKGYRRQQSETLYYPNGAIYISTKQTYLTHQSFFTQGTIGYQMEKKESIDVDDADDLRNVIGAIYFDYALREERAIESCHEKATQLDDPNATRIMIGDSRLVSIHLEGFVNYSQPGSTLHTVLEYLDSLLHPNIKEVFVSIGVNDIAAAGEAKRLKDDFERLIHLLQERHLRIYLTTIPYTVFRSAFSNLVLEEVNSWLLSYAQQKHIPILDVNDYLSEHGKLKYEYTTDGLHFKPEVSRQLEKSYTQFIQRHSL